jgi:predicted acetyltransferase
MTLPTTLSYRSIAESDYERYIAIVEQAYGNEPAIIRRWLEFDRPSELRGVYADGRLVTQMELYPLTLLAGRTTLPVAGIGSVATPPEERRRGYVAYLLQEACAEMRERGMHLALLGAFKDSFYGRYGWATISERRNYRGSPEQFAHFRGKSGQVVSVGADAVAELDAIYRGALRGRIGPFARTEFWWRNFVLGDAYWQSRNQAFVWRDESGQARSYVIYRMKQEGQQRVLRCREIVALDPQARQQILGFLSNFDSQVEQISFNAPTDAPVNLLFPNPLECTAEPWFLARVIDVAALLSAYPYPKECRGRLTLAITDSWLAHNQGVFAIEVADGAGSCTKLADDHAAELHCDIRVLGQLISRHVRPRIAAAFGLINAPDRTALAFADELFAGLAPFLADDF